MPPGKAARIQSWSEHDLFARLDTDLLVLVLKRLTNSKMLRLMRLSRGFACAAARAFAEANNMEKKQAAAALHAMLGNPTFISGGGGVGKSWVARLLVKHAIAKFGSHGVCVMAPTALAASIVGGWTIDRTIGSRRIRASELPTRVLGIEEACIVHDETPDGQEEETEEDEKLPLDECFAPVFNAARGAELAKCKVAIVDECSLVSDHKLHLLVETFLLYKGSLPQFVFVGDFAQLPPVLVTNSLEHVAQRNGKFRKFAFQGRNWDDIKPRTFELDVSRRCSNYEWNTRVTGKLRKGITSYSELERLKQDIAAFCSRSDKTPQQAAAAGLFGISGRMPKTYNDDAFRGLPGVARAFVADDEVTSWGASAGRLRMKVWVKPTDFLLVTLRSRHADQPSLPSGTLLRANADPSITPFKLDEKETGYGDKYVDVTLDGEPIKLYRVCYQVQKSMKDERTGLVEREIATRTQYPVRRVAALTVHKSQGRTFTFGQFIDFNTFWPMPGMAYVALSRTSDPCLVQHANLDKLQLLHVRPDYEVRKFYDKANARPLPFWAKHI